MASHIAASPLSLSPVAKRILDSISKETVEEGDLFFIIASHTQKASWNLGGVVSSAHIFAVILFNL